MHSTLEVRQREVLVTPEVRDYAIPVVCQNSLTDLSSESNPTLVVSKCSDVIPCKFKAVKFTIEQEKYRDFTTLKSKRRRNKTIEMKEEPVNYWTEEELKEFEEAGNRLITEALCWHENVANNIRAAYTEDSRTTIWRNKNKKKELEHDAKGMKTLDTFFKSTEASTSIFSSRSLQSSQLFPKSSSPFPKTM